MRFLQRLGNEFALRNLQERTVPAKRAIAPHLRNGHEGLAQFIASRLRVDAERLEFLSAGFRQAQFETAVAQNIQGRRALGYPPWTIDAKRREHAGMAYAKALSPKRDCRE